jgi:hypothetical protein
MINTTRQQRVALKRVHDRVVQATAPSRTPVTYRRFRRLVQPGPGCIMIPFAGMWLGIEPDGYTHS